MWVRVKIGSSVFGSAHCRARTTYIAYRNGKMLSELEGTFLFRDTRGQSGVDMAVLCQVLYDISILRQRLRSQLNALEISLLQTDGAQIKVLDV